MKTARRDVDMGIAGRGVRQVVWLSMLSAVLAVSAAVAQDPLEQAWQRLPDYTPGQDMAPLLAIDHAVIEAMGLPERRAELAARLAAVLRQPSTTSAAREYVCRQLALLGTEAEVPALAELLRDPPHADMARQALAAMPGEGARAALRRGVDMLEGDARIGVINSLGVLRDAASIDPLQRLVEAADPATRAAVWRAWGNIATAESVQRLRAEADHVAPPWPAALTAPLLHGACTLAQEGHAAMGAELLERLTQPDQPPAVRRAAWEGMLAIESSGRAARIRQWFVEDDPDRRRVAAGHLGELPAAELESLAGTWSELPAQTSLVLMEILVLREPHRYLPQIIELLDCDSLELQMAAVRYLGMVADPTVVPMLIDRLATEGELANAAQRSLARLPRGLVGPALLEALSRDDTRQRVISILKDLRYYEAIDPLIARATSRDPAVYVPALDALRGIADPDEQDIPRLVDLLLQSTPGAHRDEVERTIVVVCDKEPAGADRSGQVWKALEPRDESQLLTALPLLGRLGGDRSRERIETLLLSPQSEVRDAAVRALCNWPTAEVADRLMQLASESADRRHRRWGLRAFVRVVTLPSDRAADDSLAMLQAAMDRAEHVEDQQWILVRTSTVRSMEAVTWLGTYLDRPELAESACQALVELAHHRGFRQPNMDRFGPLLDRVIEISSDLETRERARRYRLGL